MPLALKSRKDQGRVANIYRYRDNLDQILAKKTRTNGIAGCYILSQISMDTWLLNSHNFATVTVQTCHWNGSSSCGYESKLGYPTGTLNHTPRCGNMWQYEYVWGVPWVLGNGACF